MAISQNLRLGATLLISIRTMSVTRTRVLRLCNHTVAASISRAIRDSSVRVFPFPIPPYQNLSGRPTDFAPRWSGSVTASYSLMLPGDYKVTTG